MSDSTYEMLVSNVSGVANELEAIHDGNLYENSNCEFEIIDDMDEWKSYTYEEMKREFLEKHTDFDHETYETMEDFVEAEIGTADDIEEPLKVDINDYIEHSSLSIEYWKIDNSGDCIGGEIQFAWGGPNVWATEDGVFGAWGSDKFEYHSDKAGSVILDYLRDNAPCAIK